MRRAILIRSNASCWKKCIIATVLILMAILYFRENCNSIESIMTTTDAFPQDVDSCPSPLSEVGICTTGKSAFKSMRLGSMNLMKPLQVPRPCFDTLLRPVKITAMSDQRLQNDETWSVVVAVKSHWMKFERRKFARDSWASQNRFKGLTMRLFVFFVIGAPTDEDEQITLKRENDKHGDLLQLNLTETYSNVGFKTIAGMQWVATNFPKHWIYSSSDDDMVPNLKNLLLTVQTEWHIGSNNSPLNLAPTAFPILCNYELHVDEKPIRPGGSIKNIVTQDVYSQDFYPTFCSGGFYTMSVAVCKILYRLSRFHKYFFNDDVWITGLLRLFAIDLGYLPCSDESEETCAISTNFFASAKHYRGDLQRMKREWNIIRQKSNMP